MGEIETNGTPKDQPVEEECVDNPKDKFFYKTKGKNKKPVYKKCSWLGRNQSRVLVKFVGRKLILIMVLDLLKIPVRYYVELVLKKLRMLSEFFYMGIYIERKIS